MEYQEDTEMSPILITTDLKLSVEDQHWLGALTFLEQVLTQVIERVSKKPTSQTHGTLTESINTLGTDALIESEQPPPTPDMSPIIRPELQSLEMSMPHFPMRKPKLSVVIVRLEA